MTDSLLTAKIASLLEDEDPIVTELILETIQEVEEKSLSVEAHAKHTERTLDRKLEKIGENEHDHSFLNDGKL